MDNPNFNFEKKLWKKGFRFVAGVDEVGRGCFAGPVVAAAVAFAPNSKFQFPISNEQGEKIVVNDSKKLSSSQREKADYWIKENALSFGIGEASVALINKLGMSKATQIAFRRAVSKANLKLRTKKGRQIDYLLLDAFYVPFIRGLPKQRGKKLKGSKTFKDGLTKLNSKARQLAIIDGDERSLSISAASIIAKVYRDKLMETIGKRRPYQRYDFIHNKGYGTKKHQDAIRKYGISRFHRSKFVETFLKA